MKTIISEATLETVKADIAKIIRAAVKKEINPSTVKMLINSYEEIQICQRVIQKYGTVEND